MTTATKTTTFTFFLNTISENKINTITIALRKLGHTAYAEKNDGKHSITTDATKSFFNHFIRTDLEVMLA
jgi:hypothetical protein